MNRENIFNFIIISFSFIFLNTINAYPNPEIILLTIADPTPIEINGFRNNLLPTFVRNTRSLTDSQFANRYASGEKSDQVIIARLDNDQALQMLGNQRGARLHVANGAYPVYYGIARANGNFGRYIRAFTPAEYDKLNLI